MRSAIFIFFILLFSVFAYAQQDRNQLEKEKESLEEEIRKTNNLLEKTRESKKVSSNEVTILNSKIRKRERLIRTIDSEISFINQQIQMNEDSIAKLEAELTALKEEYAKMIFYAYKNQNLYNKLLFIFSADDFNQAYQRIKYFQQYNEYRRTQARLIVETQTRLEEKNIELLALRQEKESLVSRVSNENETLIAEKDEKTRTVQRLSKKERELQATLKQKEKAAKKLQQEIQRIIAEEMRKASERAAGEKVGGYNLSSAEVALSGSFSNNMGKLPWPVDWGVISSTFGEHPHPVLTKVKVKNNGIDILTRQDSEAKAVFEGVVTRVLSVPNNNNVVIIRHGEFLTVYSNLDKVLVREGQQVKLGQPVGVVFTNPDENKTELHFEVWQSKTLLNPEVWLKQ